MVSREIISLNCYLVNERVMLIPNYFSKGFWKFLEQVQSLFILWGLKMVHMIGHWKVFDECKIGMETPGVIVKEPHGYCWQSFSSFVTYWQRSYLFPKGSSMWRPEGNNRIFIKCQWRSTSTRDKFCQIGLIPTSIKTIARSNTLIRLVFTKICCRLGLGED